MAKAGSNVAAGPYNDHNHNNDHDYNHNTWRTRSVVFEGYLRGEQPMCASA